jgi:fructose-1,6-bisphosphatase
MTFNIHVAIDKAGGALYARSGMTPGLRATIPEEFHYLLDELDELRADRLEYGHAETLSEEVDSLAKEVDQQRELLIEGEQRLERLLLDANAVVGLRRQERRPEKPTDIRLARLRRDLEAAHEFFKKATEVGSA